MATENSTKTPNRDRLLSEWLGALGGLLDTIESWAKELDWSTRRIEKKMADSQIGDHQAPALLLQKETVRVLVEPVSRTTPGTAGLVDLYLLPAYDDIASLFYYENGWNLHDPSPGDPAVGDTRELQGRPLSRESLAAVLEKLVANAA